MIVEQIWTGNQFRNFNYLIVCPETGEAMAIDPLDHEKCLAICKKNGWEITKVGIIISGGNIDLDQLPWN